jgi:hypothetical protein
MLATIFVHVPLAVLPLLQVPPAPRECQLEVLTPFAVEQQALTEFRANVDAYLTLHRRLARALPAVSAFDDEGSPFADELRAAIIAARPWARPGAFFTPGIAELFRQRIDGALLDTAEYPVLRAEEALINAEAPAVNGPSPAIPGRWQRAMLIGVLPAIPPELEYVFAAGDLALVDVPANLVIDVLPDVLPERTASGVWYR